MVIIAVLHVLLHLSTGFTSVYIHVVGRLDLNTYDMKRSIHRFNSRKCKYLSNRRIDIKMIFYSTLSYNPKSTTYVDPFVSENTASSACICNNTRHVTTANFQLYFTSVNSLYTVRIGTARRLTQ